MTVVSNEMVFHPISGQITGFVKEESPIHVFCKRFSSLPNEIQTKYEGRTHVLLLGDSMGDLSMTEGLRTEEVIRVGFLNINEQDKKEQYMEKFDIVLINDPGMDSIQKIVDRILK